MDGIGKKSGGYVPESKPGQGPGQGHGPNPGHGPGPDHSSWEIIVNGRPQIFDKNKKEISFEEVITLAFGGYESAETIVYTVSYSGGHPPNKQGTLTRGLSVRVKKGMVFNVTRTDRS